MPSPVAAAGLAFALTLLDGGKTLSNAHFSLRVPEARGALVLAFEGPDMYGATFGSPVRLRNDTDADLLALRVELVSASEAASANPNTLQPQSASSSSPPEWDVLKKGETSSALMFRAGPVGVTPETGLVILLGAVSGVAAIRSFTVEGAKSPIALETDPAGALYMTDLSGRVVRTNADGANPTEAKAAPGARPAPPGNPCEKYRLEKHPCRVAPDGGIFTIEGPEVSQYASDGKRLRSFRPGGEGPPVALAFGKEGRLYVATAGEEGRSGSVLVFRPF